MIKFRKILVPTDLSEMSGSAYNYAREIARRYNASISFIHIIPTMKYFNESLSKLGVPLDMENDLYPHAQEEAEQKLKKDMNECISEEHRGEIVVQTGRKTAAAIVDYAKSGGYDLILMASRGEHDTDLMRGGVTEKVIRQSEVPVFAVNKRLTTRELNQILVPTDASGLSFTSFPLAVSLADIYDAELTLLHVIELHGSKIESDAWDHSKSEAENIYDNIVLRLQDYLARHKLNEIAVTVAEGDFEARVVVSEGNESKTIPLHIVIERGVTAHAVIEDYASDKADVVVITTHGRGGLAHFLLGSTTEKVIQHVNLPVLTVKPKREELEAGTEA